MAAGRKTGGRTKGTPNRASADIRALAQQSTDDAVAALVRGLRDPQHCITAARILIAYSHGLPRAALDITVKPVYAIADRALTADEWASKYADPAVDAPVRPAKRAR